MFVLWRDRDTPLYVVLERIRWTDESRRIFSLVGGIRKVELMKKMIEWKRCREITLFIMSLKEREDRRAGAE